MTDSTTPTTICPRGPWNQSSTVSPVDDRAQLARGFGDAMGELVALLGLELGSAAHEEVAEALDDGQRGAQVVDERAQRVGLGVTAHWAARRARSRRARARARWHARDCAPAACE